MGKDIAQNTTGGLGFIGALTIAFIVLKLTEVIDWSWWWVLSPLWLPFAFVSCIFFIFILVIIIIGKKHLW